MASVMSTPITRPVGPTWRAARKQSNPAPLPRSSTVSPGFMAATACGLPQESPRFAPSGSVASSAGRIAERDGQPLGVIGAAAQRAAGGLALGDLAILLLHRRLDLSAFHRAFPFLLYPPKRIYLSKKTPPYSPQQVR